MKVLLRLRSAVNRFLLAVQPDCLLSAAVSLSHPGDVHSCGIIFPTSASFVRLLLTVGLTRGNTDSYYSLKNDMQ